MNTGTSFSEQRYPDYVSCFQQLAGWTPLKKFFLVEGQCFPLSFFVNPLLGKPAGGMNNVVPFLVKKDIYIFLLPFHWVMKDFFPLNLMRIFCKRLLSDKVRMKISNFPRIMKPHGDHPKNVSKLTNIRYSTSEQQYPDSVSCFQHLAGWTPLRKLFLEKAYFTKSFFLNPLLDSPAGGMISLVTIL